MKIKKLFICLCLGFMIFCVSGCEDDNATVTTFPSNMQGVYTYQHTNTMSKYVRYCSTYGLKINSTNVQMTSVSCGNELDFNSSTAKTYTVENLYLYSNNSEGASFDLYLDGTKEYECTRSFGSVYCTSKSGSSYSYKMSSE